MHEKIYLRDEKLEKQFLEKIMIKLNTDFKGGSAAKKSSVKFLHDCFGDLIDDYSFTQWLPKKINYKPIRLLNLLKNCEKLSSPKNILPSSVHENIYKFWLQPETSVLSTDRREGRDKIKISKLSYLSRQLNAIEDNNIEEQIITFKKTGKTKTYVTAQRLVYTKSVRELHKKFIEISGVDCSLSLFFKYKPFYVIAPTEREQQSCLCIRCQNSHLLLKGVNSYRKMKKLSQHTSVTAFLHDYQYLKLSDRNEKYPEFNDDNEIKYYIFGPKTESYFKDGKEVQYKRTARTDKKDKVSAIALELISIKDSYLKHRSHVDNINRVFPIVKEAFQGAYIELDFSENIAIKPKFEVQEAQFSGKQYSLHCSIVEPGINKYVYHLCDDTKHDPIFVDEVLEDIFTKRNIKNETVMIKSDNAPTQYKNKYAFYLLQQIANKFNVTIGRIYGAAGHGKGLIDAMSSFGVKGILRRDIIGNDEWFSNSDEICDYLSMRGDPRMSYTSIEPKQLDQKRSERKGLVINGCMVQHMLLFKPNCNGVVAKEYLCDCIMCLALSFDNCENKEDTNENSTLEDINSGNNDSEWHCDSEETVDKNHIFEFVDAPSFVAVLSSNLNEPVYFIKVEEKGISESELKDRYGHVVFVGEPYFKGKYLQIIRSRNNSTFQFKLLPHPIYIEPDEVYQPFVEIDQNLTITKELYSIIVSQL